MKNKSLLLAVAISATLLAGCKNGVNGNLIASSGMSAYKAATLSDADVKALSNNACKQMDSENQLAGSKSKYTKRLSKIAKALGNNIDGTPVSYKVYMTSDINAWAMANGCVRVYSGLMDLMTDNEIEGVLGHELGHVSLGHSRKAMQPLMPRWRLAMRFPPPAASQRSFPSLNWAIWRKASSIRRFLAVRSRMRMTSLTIC